jgi:uncharacterized repeat protein (TIGR03809 family)
MARPLEAGSPVPWGAQRMPAGIPAHFDAVTQRWRELALRRHAYYLELFKSGRWTRYFTEQEFLARMRDVVTTTAFWNGLAEKTDFEARACEQPAPEARSAA